MLNNDVLRRLRYILDYSDSKMMNMFKVNGMEVSREVLSKWLKKEDDADYLFCKDVELATFLNSLINEKRGKREGEQPKTETVLNNNLVFRKLLIAFNLKNDEALDILALADFKMSKHEMSAFFRKPGHKNYRECKAQILRNFLQGLQIKLVKNETIHENKTE